MSPMSANSAARAASFIFRPSAASAYSRYRIPNAAAAYRRHMSELPPARRVFLVDTLALVRGMEAQGIESKHAEAITSAITTVLNDTLENISESFISKGEMQKRMMVQDANLAKLKCEFQSSQEHHFALLQWLSEKFQADNDLLYGRIHLELAKHNAVTTKQNADLADRTSRQIADSTDRIWRLVTEAIEVTSKQIADVSDRTSKKIAEAMD